MATTLNADVSEASVGRIFRRWQLAVLVVVAGWMCVPGPVRSETFQAYVDGLRRDALQRGHARGIVDRAVATVSLDRTVAALALRQPEFVKPLWDYLKTILSRERISAGLRAKNDWRRTLAATEKRYGVDRYTVLAIWGIESSYGRVLDNHAVVRPLFRSLASLGFAAPRRRTYAKSQFMAALRVAARNILPVEALRGSWAGAMGHTQFIPTTYLAYAVDFSGDGQADIWRSVPDALASTANYLEKRGWKRGMYWGLPVQMPRRFDYRLIAGEPYRNRFQWHRLGVRAPGGGALPEWLRRAKLTLPAGVAGPAFLLTPNFKAILAYNNSNAYAYAVSMLADVLRGMPPAKLNWSMASPPLDKSERRVLQRLLNRRGFSAGPVDGRIGKRTRAALRAYQSRAGLPPDGYASKELLKRIRGD